MPNQFLLEYLYENNQMPDNISQRITDYFGLIGIDSKIKEIIKYTTNFETFKKRFYQWFDAFALMKMVHYFRDNYYPNVEVAHAASELIRLIDPSQKKGSERDLLVALRRFQTKEIL